LPPQKILFPTDNLPVKIRPARRLEQIFAGKLSAGKKLFWGRSYNGTPAQEPISDTAATGILDTSTAGVVQGVYIAGKSCKHCRPTIAIVSGLSDLCKICRRLSSGSMNHLWASLGCGQPHMRRELSFH